MFFRPLEWTDLESERGRIAVFGAPLDATQSFRPGAREGPRAIRDALLRGIEFYSLELGGDLETLPIADLGDLPFTNDVNQMLSGIRRAIEELVGKDRTPGVIGGEHTITLAAYEKFCGSLLVIFDAHLDLRDELYGQKVSHGTFLRRLVEACADAKIIHIGSRAASPEEWSYAKAAGFKIFTPYQIDEAHRKLRELAENASDVYVSLDVDVLDPAYAPGVSTPEPGGLTSRELLRLLGALRGARILGFDVVELTPSVDPSGITAVMAAKLLLMLSALAWLGLNKK